MKNGLYFLLALILLINGQPAAAAASVFDCSTVTEIPVEECNALVALYNTAGGTQWTVKTNWLVTLTPSNWYGVTVTSGHVTALQLNSNNLTMGLPAALGDLTQLTSLELQGNYLWAGIPVEIGNLVNLETLRLDNGGLHGSIPASLSNLTNLRILRLNNNILTGDIPESLISLVNLYNPGLAPDGGDGLDLDLNKLNIPVGYPDPLNPFHTFLHTKDPDWHLRQWGAFVNCAAVFDIPEAECDVLVTMYNQTNGPNWVNKTNWLTTNAIGGWFGVEVEAGHVVELFMPFNNMSGPLPSDLGDLLYVRGLTLFDNHLTGDIPAGVVNMTNLAALYLYNNELTGPIPAGLGNLTKLYALMLGGNHLTGNIPPELGNLTKLIYLTVGSNQLTGNIPPVLGNLTLLERLSLGGNSLNGTIPAELGELINLKYLDISGTQLTGNIPAVLGNLTQLEQLRLGYNQFYGTIPAELGGLIKLQYLSLRNNHLTGDVPGTLINLINLFDAGGLGGADSLYLDYNLLNVPPDYPNPGNPFHVFLHQKDLDWQLSQTNFMNFFLPMTIK